MHSGLRWVVLFLLIFAIYNAITGKKRGTYEKKDKLINLFTMISLHTQLLIGLVLYFISPKVSFIEGWMKESFNRFYGMEHFLMMVIAIVIVTIGSKTAEKLEDISAKHKKITIMYTIALILILAAIPWPFRTELGGKWF
jgi:membrane protein DedA with SNARE-associated domain